MDGLRWLLLLFGVLVIAGVYFYSRRERERPGEVEIPERRLTPTLEAGPVDEAPAEPAPDDDAAAGVRSR